MANDFTQNEPLRTQGAAAVTQGQGHTNGTNGTAATVRRPAAPSPLPPPAAPPQPLSRPPKKGGLGFFFWLILLLLLAGAGWTIYHFYFQPQPKQAGNGQTAAASGSGGGHHKGGAAGDKIRVVPATAAKGDIDIFINGIGSVTPYNTVTLQARVSGQLMEVDYKDGQSVKIGDKLVQIDDRPFKAQLEQFQAQKLHDQALLDNANTDLKRYQVLFAQNSIQQQTLATQESLVKQDEGTVASDQAQVDQTQLNITYCDIRSPIDGVVGLKLVDIGNQVFANSTTLVIINQIQPIYVDFTINESAVPALMKKVTAGVQLPVDVYDGFNTTKLSTGTLLTPDNQINTATISLKLRALVENKDGALFPNQAINGHLLIETHKDVVLIPTAAIQHGTQGTFVYTINDDDPKNVTVTMTPVKLAQFNGYDVTNNGQVEVQSGVQEGDEVVVDGVDKLANGIKVIVARSGDNSPGDTTNAPASPAPAN
jgi:membrane fusion protein, multidrug efflux system